MTIYINKETALAKLDTSYSMKNLLWEYQIRKLNILDIYFRLKSQSFKAIKDWEFTEREDILLVKLIRNLIHKKNQKRYNDYWNTG